MHARAESVAPRGRHRAGVDAVWLGAVAGLCALVLYAATAARGVEWQDSGIHQYRILTGQLEHPRGLALSHPLHYWLGRAALRLPLGDPVYKLNLMSALFGAVGVGVLAGLVIRLTRSRFAGALAAATLALTLAYWQMSALTETYTLAAALMIVAWALLLRYVRTRHPLWLIAVFAVNGLHVADHLLGLLTLATYAVLLLDRIARRKMTPVWVPVAAAVWLVTASPYWALVLSHYQQVGDLGATVQSALFGAAWQEAVLNVHLTGAQVKLAVMTFAYCFPSAVGLLALLGMLRRAHGRRRLFRWVLLGQTVIIFVFVGRYRIVDLYTYFVPVCALVALWAGLGAAGLMRRWRSAPLRRGIAVLLAANVLLPLLVYYAFPLVAQQRGWLRGRLRDLPYRNEYFAFFRPWRFNDDSAALLARDVLERAGDSGWVVADSTAAPPIAVTYLTRGGPRGARVYWYRRCASDPGRPALTDAEFVAHVRAGGRVVAVPWPGLPDMVPDQLVIEEAGPYAWIRMRPPDGLPAAAP